MAKEFNLSVVAPDRSVVEEPVVSVVAPGSEGYFGVLAGHIPLIASLKPGLLEYQVPTGERHHIAVGGGFVEVTGERVTVLANSAERATEIDVEQARTMLEEARRALRGEDSPMTQQEATEQLAVAVTLLQAAKASIN